MVNTETGNSNMKKTIKDIKRVKKTIKSFLNRYINGTKGAISLFLAILMVPFATIAGSLINAARINSAVAIFDEALCNASNSTLGTYDSFLRERFGLLAMSQNTASKGEGYTVQNLISDTFVYYMEKNVGTLSNTYIDYDVSATGVFPLADTDVLLSEILEYSKYTIPAKLVIDGLSIDDLIKNLTEKLNFVGTICNTLSSGAGMVDKFKSCQEKIDALRTAIDTTSTAKTDYDTAYSEFTSAVNGYNSLIDELKSKIAEKQNAVNTAQSKVNSCKLTFDSEAAKIPSLIQELDNLKNEKDSSGRKVDNTQKIKEFKEEHSSELSAYLAAEEALNSANSELSSAKQSLQSVIDSYNNKLSEKRTAVTTNKQNYVEKIGALASAVKSTGDATVAAQSSVSSAINAGVSLTSNIITTVYESQKLGIDKEKQEMKDNQQAAKDRGDNTAAYLWQDQMDEVDERKTAISNNNTLAKAATGSVSTAVSSLNQFTSDDYQSKYATIYSNLIDLKTRVSSYQVKTDYSSRLESTASYYVSVIFPLTSGDVQKLEDNLASEIGSSSFFAVIKAIAGFIKAIFTLSVWYDPELTATVDNSNYSNIGGLPSTKDRSDNSQYSLKSGFEDSDSQKSDYYKQLLGEYSNNPAVTGSATTMGDVMTAITEDMNTISACCGDWHWYNIFSNLATMLEAVGDMISQVLTLAKNVLEIIVSSVESKIMLAGYIGYNTSNRTTYSGSALTGKAYSLPNKQSNNQGYAFYGAETEYIFNGSLSEQDNQTKVFHTIYLLRLLYDVICVVTNDEVATIAGEAGAATFGIGTVVVYILYIVAEPFVDTLILVNSGDIPMIKTKVYLTPSGVVDLIKSFMKLKLTADQKNTAYKEITKVAGAGFVDSDFADDYASAVSAFGTGSDNVLTKSMTFDYTKTLVIVMMLFESSDKMLDRLADVVQMEGSYNAVNRIDKYTFNLDESYTYLRASGKFTTNEFISISNATGLNSKERVVYRGY